MAFIKCFWKLNFYFQCLQKNIKIKKIYCPKRTFKNAWFGGPIWWTISKLSIFFFFCIQEHLALECTSFCKSFCKTRLSSLVTQEQIWKMWMSNPSPSGGEEDALARTYTNTHIHTHSLWEASVGRRQGAEGWLEPYEQPAGIFSFHSNHIIHTTICFSCVKKCFYGIRID